jgi:signal transduction histidine kinase
VEAQLSTFLIHATENALPTLFRKYMQVSADHARKYGGTGLGLAICKQLVNFLSTKAIFDLQFDCNKVLRNILV